MGNCQEERRDREYETKGILIKIILTSCPVESETKGSETKVILLTHNNNNFTSQSITDSPLTLYVLVLGFLVAPLSLFLLRYTVEEQIDQEHRH